MDKALVLIGMMGAGKTSVGRILADETGWPFIDTDLLLQNRLGRPIPQIFQVYGEDAFRDHETNVLKSLEPTPSIISTGGGIVIRPENWVEMRRLGTIVYLRAPLEILVERLETSKKKRPLLQTDDWIDRLASILQARSHLYEQADMIVDVGDGDIEIGVERLRTLTRKRDLA